MGGTDLALLRELATMGCIHKRAHVTTASLAKVVGLSQQSISLSLIRLQGRGLIERSMAARGQFVKVTKGGVAALKKEYSAYKRIFEEGDTITISGIVATGFGEGAYYLSRKGYRDALKLFLGAKPYSGTLNVKPDAEGIESLDCLSGHVGQGIPGFVEGGRTFGPIKAFKAEIEGVESLVVMPSRTHHRDVLEVVAAVNLRDTLDLKDGSRVSIKVTMA
jgi:riboflavin kinase